MSVVVQEVSKQYGSQLALDSVSFSIGQGEITGFLGPNGAGKSTMMKIITCFIPPSSGNVLVSGISIHEDPLAVKREVGYLPEHNPLYLEMYVKEYLEFTARIYKIRKIRSRIAKMIEMTGLGREQNKKIGTLSKGYRQRVGLAQALIHDPRVLILDEPTSGLDPNQLEEIRALIRDIGKEKTVMLSTHIMQEVEAICHRVIIINQGVIVANSNAADLRSAAENRFIYNIEFDKEVKPALLKKVPGITKVIPGEAKTFILEATEDIRPALFRFAVEHELTVLTMQKQEQKLEELFKKLTSGKN